MSLIYARPATATDLPAIMTIIEEARAFLKASGSSQWQGEYPNRATIEDDLANGNAWVLVVDQQVAAYAAAVVGVEPTYLKIEEGAWANDDAPYATIHRLAISSAYRGQHLANYFLSNLISLQLAAGVRNFRIDTSRHNQVVQHLADSHRFDYRGIIYVDEDPVDKSRLAYELNL